MKFDEERMKTMEELGKASRCLAKIVAIVTKEGSIEDVKNALIEYYPQLGEE